MPPMLFWTHWSPTSTPAEPRTPLEALSTPWWSGIQMQPSGVPAAAPPPKPWPLLNPPCLHADRMRLSGPLLCDRSGLRLWLDKARGRSAPAARAPQASAALASHQPTGSFQNLPPHHRPPLPHLQTNKVTCSPITVGKKSFNHKPRTDEALGREDESSLNKNSSLVAHKDLTLDNYDPDD